MSPWSTAGISLIEAFGDVGTPYGEIETVFYLDNFGPMFGNDQDADILYSTTIGQMIIGVPADAGDNEPILNIVPHTAGVTYSSDPATVLDAVHPTVIIWDSGVTDLIAFYNDDTLSHILSEVAGGVEVDIGLWLGDATGDQAKVRIYGYDETAAAAGYYTIGTHDDGNNLLSLQIGLLTTTQATRNLVVCARGDTPALNVEPLNTIAHPKMSIWGETAGVGDFLVIYNDDTDSWIRTGAGGIFFDAIAAGDGVDIRFYPENTPVIDIGADVFEAGVFIKIGYDTAETSSGALTVIEFTNDAALTLGGDLTGIDINFSANLTPATDHDIIGFDLVTPAFTQVAANITTYTGFQHTSGGAIIQNTDAGTINWYCVDVSPPQALTDDVVAAIVNLVGFRLATAGSLEPQAVGNIINWTGAEIQLPNMTETAGTLTVVGIDIDAGIVNSGTAYGIDIDMEAAFTAAQIGIIVDGDARQLQVCNTDEALLIRPTTTGAGVDIAIDPLAAGANVLDIGADVFTIGTFITVGYDTIESSTGTVSIFHFTNAAALTLGGDLMGMNIDFNANITAVTDHDITVYQALLPALTQSVANITNYKGFHIATAGALAQDSAAGTINWSAVEVAMPQIAISDAFAGMINAYGFYIDSVGSLTSGAAGNVATFVGIYLTTPAITETAGSATAVGYFIETGTYASGTVYFELFTDSAGEVMFEFISRSATITHPTMRIYDSGGTDYIAFYDDDSYSWIVTNPNPLNVQVSGDTDDYIQFTTQTSVPGFTSIGDVDLDIQNQAAARPYDVTFFANQTVPAATPLGGSTPEIRIYGWSSATINAQVYSAIWTGAVPEGHAETNDEIGVMYINPANNYLILANQGAAANMPEITTAATHATLRIYDSGWTDYMDLYNDDSNSFINSVVNDLILQGNAATTVYDVEFFSKQTDPGTAAMAAGEVPEIRIYGWDHADTSLRYTVLRTSSVAETVDPTDDEHSFFMIGVDPLGSRKVVICDADETTIEFAAVVAHPTLVIFDAGATDYLQFYDTGAASWINSNPNAIRLAPNADTDDYIEFSTQTSVPGFTSIGDCDLSIQNQVAVNPFDVMFFASQTVPAATPAAGSTPELRIYGWSSATINTQVYSSIKTSALEEGIAETGDETAVMRISPANNYLIIQEIGDNIEVNDVSANPRIVMYDSGGTDWFSFYDDGSFSVIIANPNPIALRANNDADNYIVFQTPANVPGFYSTSADMDIQNAAVATIYDVTFFANQADPGTDVIAAGQVPELRIYGWQHITANEGLAYASISVVSVGEGADPDDDEYAYLKIGVPSDDANSRDSRAVIICDYDDTPEQGAVFSNPSLVIYDADAVDYMRFIVDTTYANWYSNFPIAFYPSGDADDFLVFSTISGVPGFTTSGDCDLAIQNQAAADPFDVTFFANQTDPGTAVMAAGEVPEIRIYGWDHAGTSLRYTVLRTFSVAETVDPTDDECAIFMIGLDPAGSRRMIICDADETIIEFAVASAHPTLHIYDASAADRLDIYNDGTNAFINSSNDILLQGDVNTIVFDVEFFSKQTDPGTGVMAAGEVPEIRIYGWDHADTTVRYTVLRTSSVAETVDPTDDEHSFFMIGVDPLGSRRVIICDADETTIEFAAVSADPMLILYDAGATDRLAFFDDGAKSVFTTNSNPIYLLPATGVVRFRDAEDTDNTLYLEISTPDDGTYVQLLESGNSLMTQMLILGFVDSRPTISGTHGAEIHGFTGVAAGAAGKGRLTSGAGTISYCTVAGATDETNHLTIGFDVPDLAIDTGTAADFTIEIEFDPAADGDKFDIALLDSVYGFIGTQTITASGAAKQWSTVFNIGALTDTGTFVKGDSLILYITKCTDSARTGAANIDFYRTRIKTTVGIEIDTV